MADRKLPAGVRWCTCDAGGGKRHLDYSDLGEVLESKPARAPTPDTPAVQFPLFLRGAKGGEHGDYRIVLGEDSETK